ncbi:MAG: O-antigen ligase family protein [Bacteroidetes bacterium]|nr:O-antigen ligase family protein [Bacteroidota bacterium]
MKELKQKGVMIQAGSIRDVVFGLVYLVFFGYFLLVYPFAFNFELYMHGHYVSVVIGGVAILAYGLLWLADDGWRGRGQGGCLVLLLIAAAYLCVPSYRGNEYLVNVSIAGVCLILLRSMNLDALCVLLIIVAAGGVLELVLALVPAWRSFSGEAVVLTGSLHNSGVLAVFLIIQAPLLWYAIDHCSRKWVARRGRRVRNILFIPVALLILSVGVYSKARVAIFTAAVLGLLAVRRYLKKNLLRFPVYARVLTWILLAGAVFISGYYFYHLKEGSSIGRLLILDVAFRHIPDHFWLGTGPGRFSWYYPQWQAGYFLAHPQPGGPFFLSAGETYVAFNEFLQLFETFGLMGSLLVLLSCVWFFTAESTKSRDLLFACKATVVAILSCCCFHYPLHQNAILLILALCFSIVAAVRENVALFSVPAVSLKSKWLLSFGVATVALGGAALFTGCRQYVAMERWQAIRDDDRTPHNALKKDAIGCYARLCYDGKFLAEYGAFLAQDPADLPDAISVSEASRETFISWRSIEDLAYFYLEHKQYACAISTFEWLSGYVPNRYRPRMELLELYKRTNRPDSARRTAGFILAMPVKVASDEVSEIKKEAEIMLKTSQ